MKVRNLETQYNNKVAFYFAFQAHCLSYAVAAVPLIGYAVFAARHGSLDDSNPAIVLVAVTVLALDINFWAIIDASQELITAWLAVERVQAFLLAKDRPNQIGFVLDESNQAVSLCAAEFVWTAPAAINSADQSDPDSSALPDSAETQEIGEIVASTPMEIEIKSSARRDARKQAEPALTLTSMSLTLRSGELVALVGPSQAGKTSLLSALLGDMNLVHGRVDADGLPTYCPQEPWIMTGTIRDNILFGLLYDAERYNHVINSCALHGDLELMPRGDLSQLGERGITLSGGQKARLHLARTVYQTLTQRRRLALLDDPLSAVDAKTCSILFNEAITGALKDSCRVLATHQLQVLPQCDRILYMQDGRIVADGTYAELMSIAVFADFVGSHSSPVDDEPTIESLGLAEDDSTDTDDQMGADSHVVIDDEERANYRIPWKLYLSFAPTLSKKLMFLGILGILLLGQVGLTLANFQTAWWTADTYHLSLDANIGLYAAFIGVHQLAWALHGWLTMRFFVNQAYHTHNDALKGVLHAPLSLFHANPHGRLINRFTHDIITLDSKLPSEVWSGTLESAYLLVNIIAIAVYVPIVLALILAWIVGSYILSWLFKSTPLEIKRLSVNLQSSYLAQVTEGLHGRTTINLADQIADFTTNLQSKIDDYNSVQFLPYAAFAWVTLVNNFGFAFILFCAGFLLLSQRFNVDSSVLVLSQGLLLLLCSLVQRILLAVSECQKGVNAMERLTHYATDLPSEGDHGKKFDQMEKSWPASGAIQFENVYMQYDTSLPMALKELSMAIRPCEKVGVVGRTGAGKSSLLMAILRLVPLSHGNITIDGIDIMDIGLDDLRHAIATIPQDPILFIGTVRFNLDPTGTTSDEHLNAALAQVHLIGPGAEGSGTPLSLDTKVQSRGAKFSAGQKQMLSLARALAKRAKIIIMDEASSNVDTAKDTRRFVKCLPTARY